MAERLRQIVPNRWASVRKRSFTKCFCVYPKGDKCTGVVTVWLDCEVEGDESDMLGIVIFLLLFLLLLLFVLFLFFVVASFLSARLSS